MEKPAARSQAGGYRLWTDADAGNLIREFYPEYLDAYLAMPRNIMRAGMMRYFIMQQIGAE